MWARGRADRCTLTESGQVGRLVDDRVQLGGSWVGATGRVSELSNEEMTRDGKKRTVGRLGSAPGKLSSRLTERRRDSNPSSPYRPRPPPHVVRLERRKVSRDLERRRCTWLRARR